MDETQDPKPHPFLHEGLPKSDAIAPSAKGESLSIWFFCGILTLGYGLVLVGTGIYEHFGHQPQTVLAHLEPTLWWGVCMLLFGLFYTIRFRPGKR
jgi:hypothetical protein